MWKNWQPADANIPEDERDFQGKVVQIVNSDSLAVETASGLKQIYLASVRPARIEDLADELQSKARSNEKSAQAIRSKVYMYYERHSFNYNFNQLGSLHCPFLVRSS